MSLSAISWCVGGGISSGQIITASTRFRTVQCQDVRCKTAMNVVGAGCTPVTPEITPLKATSDICWVRRDTVFVRDCHEILMNLCLDCNCLPENTEETVRAGGRCLSLGDGDRTKLRK